MSTAPPPLPEKIVIRVTKTDIKNGVRESCHFCPIAIATIRTLKLEDKVKALAVDSTAIEIYEPDFAVYGLTLPALNFIIDFDRGMPVKPFQFTAHRQAFDEAVS